MCVCLRWLCLRLCRGGKVIMRVTKNLKESGKWITEPGMHHFRRGGHRIHLRISENGRGILTVDASRIIHFNPVAVDMAWMILSEVSEKKILKSLRKRYSVKKKQVASDLKEFGDVLQNILDTGASEPITFVNMEVTEPFQAKVEVPYRMDLALTYRCNINCSHCYNQTRDKNELSTDQWKTVMNKIWDLGIATDSAAKTAAMLNIDNRIMYTVGYTAQKQEVLFVYQRTYRYTVEVKDVLLQQTTIALLLRIFRH